MLRRIAPFLLAIFAAASPVAAETVVVALAAPLSGRYADYGQAVQAGAALAVDDLNSAGGVAGQKLVLRLVDDACQRTRAADNARQLVEEGVRFVIGHVCSGSSEAASRIYASAGMLHISLASIGPLFSDARPGSTIFQLTSGDAGQGEAAGGYIARAHAGKRIGILHDRTAYGSALAAQVRQAITAAGVREVMFEAIRPGEKDYSGAIAALKAAAVDVVYFGGFATEAAIIVRQMRQAGMGTILMGSDVLAGSDFTEQAGAVGDGTLLTFKMDASRSPSAAEVAGRLRAAGVSELSLAVQAYAAIEIWVQAARSASTLTPADLSSALGNGAPTILGDIAFDPRGRSNLPSFSVQVWKDGARSHVD